MSNTDSSKRRRFAIALSFPGERYEYVEQVVNALLPAFGGIFHAAPPMPGDRQRGRTRAR
jgi:hypothetical protein